MPARVAALALLLALPSLGLGLQTDDHLMVERFVRGGGSPWLFEANLAPDGPRGGAWWNGDVSIRFLRPLAVLSHRLDVALFGDVAWPMHLLNALLYAAFAALAALGFKRVLGAGTSAGLAALMFAVDDAHAGAVGWISSRNTLLASVFALAAWLLHARARALEAASQRASTDRTDAPPAGERAQPRDVWLARLASPLCTALALFSAEIGLTALAYLLAHALVLETGPLLRRLRGLAPHVVVAAVWAGVYVAIGAGVRNASWYRDVAAAPFDALLQGVLDVPTWLWSQLGLSVVSGVASLPPPVVRVACALLVLPLLAALLPALRASRAARFFALGMLLCIPPLWTTVPQDRLLLGASFGGFGLIACALHELAAHTRWLAVAARRTFVLLHLGLAPLLFMPVLGGLSRIENGARALAAAVPGDRATVIINLPIGLLTLYTRTLRAETGLVGPPMLDQLYAGGSPLTLTRSDSHTLELSAERGWGAAPTERTLSSERHLRALAQRPVHMKAFTARVVATTPDGRPRRVRFTFPTALEQERAWLVWRGTRPVPFELPAVGERVELPRLALFTALE
jgi:hypothetical protein